MRGKMEMLKKNRRRGNKEGDNKRENKKSEGKCLELKSLAVLFVSQTRLPLRVVL